MMLLIFLSSFAIFGAPGTYGYSKNVWDLISYVNGDWDNKDQFDVGEGGHDFVQGSWIPVEVPALGSDPVMLLEQDVNGVIELLYLVVVTDGPANSVTMKVYYGFTDFSDLKFYNVQVTAGVLVGDQDICTLVLTTRFPIGEQLLFPSMRSLSNKLATRPRTYNTEELSQLKLEDLHSDDDCFASFLITPNGVVNGDFPNCKYTFNGTHPRFTLSLSCDAITAIFPRGTNQQFTAIPYYFPRMDLGYPLKNLPEGYVSPCN